MSAEELTLQEKRVVVARVRQIQDGPLPCPEADGFRRFDCPKGVMTHVGKFHPEFVLEDCAECGQPFHRSQQRKEFCSVECYQANVRDQVTRFCEGGGASVVVKAPHADGREYCSRCATATATGKRGPVRCVARSSRRPPRTGKAEGTLFARMNARAPVK